MPEANVSNLKDTIPIVHAPHSPLTDYYSDEASRRGWISRMFDSTAADYDRIEALLSFGSGSWYRGQALLRAGLQPGMRVADIGMGTGLVSAQAAHIVGDPALVTGVDPSPGMLRNARVPAGVTIVEGRAESIPFPDNTFDFLSMGYALRHISDLSLAFTELRRVLKPGGRLCILEITCPEKGLRKWMLKTYLRNIVPTLAAITTRNRDTSVLWRYYWDSIEACATPASVVSTLSESGFTAVHRHLENGIFSEYRAQRPA
ncbi:dimethylmenaquinone methyltransferase [Verrucomicrobia bacterium LW23]|nr:dimethylmenaquinone methyltransferase [Verrucomicrobia bacterium LW23]